MSARSASGISGATTLGLRLRPRLGTRRSPTRSRAVAQGRGVAPAQIALAWVQGQGERLGVSVAPIPGTKRIKWLEQNVAALDIKLTTDELAVLDPLADQVVGGRY